MLAVVFYHYGVPGITGGFVGVDIFFVISGYLITNLLITELNERGRIDFLRFYGRRARRLLPAAFAVTIVVIISGVVILSPPEQIPVAKAGAASSLYVSNFWFLQQTFDYFAPESALNPFLHTWSLSVEEQFYVIWPTVLMLAAIPESSFPFSRNCDRICNGRLIYSVLMAHPNETTLGILLVANTSLGVWARWISNSRADYAVVRKDVRAGYWLVGGASAVCLFPDSQ